MPVRSNRDRAGKHAAVAGAGKVQLGVGDRADALGIAHAHLVDAGVQAENQRAVAVAAKPERAILPPPVSPVKFWMVARSLVNMHHSVRVGNAVGHIHDVKCRVLELHAAVDLRIAQGTAHGGLGGHVAGGDEVLAEIPQESPDPLAHPRADPAGFSVPVSTRPVILRSVSRPTRCALSTVIDGVGEAHHDRSGIFQRERLRRDIRIWRRDRSGTAECAVRPSSPRQFSAGPSMCSVPSSEPANRRRLLALCGAQPGLQARQVHLGKSQRGRAGVIAIQAPLAIAFHRRAGYGGIQMRAQREPLRTGGQVRIAQRLAGELHALGDDIGVQFIDAVSGLCVAGCSSTSPLAVI